MRLWLSVCACVLVPVGGGPPARSPHTTFARSGRSRSPARPCRRPPAPRPGPRCPPHRRCGALPARRPCRELCSEWSISKPGQALPPRGLFCWAGPLCVPVGGGPPARRPRRELRSARRLEARPGPAAAHRHRGRAPGVLHTSGAGCADDWLGVSSRSPARPCRRVACFVGPGRCVCRWAAARPLAVRAASCARRVVSKPGQALPPPTCAAVRSSSPSGALHTGGAWCAGVLFVVP